jgi:hypothetical protein
MYVMLGVGASGLLFGTARFFARGQPATMTKEYQEASNEYLKVCLNFWNECSRYLAVAHAQYVRSKENTMLTTFRTTGPEGRAYHWCLVRGLLRCRHGPEQA